MSEEESPEPSTDKDSEEESIEKPESDGPSRSEATPYVSYTLLAANLLLWIISSFIASRGHFRSALAYGADVEGLVGVGGNNAAFTFGEGQWWRLLSASFLHGGLLHIAFNSYALYLYGPVLERAMGRGIFLLLYLLSGVGGFALSAEMNPQVVSVGASASIFGLVGALWALLRRRKAPSSAVQSVLWVIGINFAWGLQPGSNIDNWGHGGGLIAGYTLGYALDSLSLRGVQVWRRLDRASLQVSLVLLAYASYGTARSMIDYLYGVIR